MSNEEQNSQNVTENTTTTQGETKKCKYCQSDIPKKAKVCPVCKKKQKKNIVLIIILIFVILSFTMCGTMCGLLGEAVDETVKEETKKLIDNILEQGIPNGNNLEYLDKLVTIFPDLLSILTAKLF